jgi:hypothetical protein
LRQLPDYAWIEDFINPKKSRKLKEGEYYYTLRGHMDALIQEQDTVGNYAL